MAPDKADATSGWAVDAVLALRPRQLWRFCQLDEEQIEAKPLIDVLVRSPRFSQLPALVPGVAADHPRAVYIDRMSIANDDYLGDPVVVSPETARTILRRLGAAADLVSLVVLG